MGTFLIPPSNTPHHITPLVIYFLIVSLRTVSQRWEVSKFRMMLRHSLVLLLLLGALVASALGGGYSSRRSYGSRSYRSYGSRYRSTGRNYYRVAPRYGGWGGFGGGWGGRGLGGHTTSYVHHTHTHRQEFPSHLTGYLPTNLGFGKGLGGRYDDDGYRGSGLGYRGYDDGYRGGFGSRGYTKY